MTSWIVLSLILSGGFHVYADNLALLSGTLRTYQRAGCDDEVVTLKCPPGTSISIEVAQYGKSAPSKSLCGVRSTPSAISRMSYSYNVSCLWPNAIQSKWEGSEGNWGRYSLLQTVVETCQKKRQCKFQPNPKTFGGDPCPGVRKYVEVAYKCRPYEFRSKVACENERIQLKCNPNSRVAVYSASYGRTEYESIQCPQPQGVPEETCLVSYATETVMQLCHGKRTCDLTADISTFGSPCKPQSRMYLKVVYTCVPRKVLKEQYEGALEPDETEDEFSNDEDDDFDVYDAGNEFIRESAASPPAPNIEGIAKDNFTKDISDVSSKTPPHKSNGFDFAPFQPHTTPRSRSNPFRSRSPTMQKTTKDMLADVIPDPNCTITVYAGSDPSQKTGVIGFISEWINAYAFVSQNQERFFLYLIVSVAAGLLLLLSFLVGRLLLQRHRARREAKFHATNISENTLPNGFTDDISEVDADIDLTTPLPGPVPSVTIHSPPMGSIAEVVRYPHVHSHTLRRPPQAMESDMPRSLSSASSTHYYYG
ncbi:protein eva-1 isoform X2 [Anoplophora glabripennis]|uniref:protein eva-1 isoform X2 n=1 Tax=Anoplophora glabripennis TaxID=217634 RepID=UPI0008750D0E|nr:protein eva-1 isoform X2 [Anoplophora glabripennis]